MKSKYELWLLNEAAIHELQTILNSKVMQDALDVLKELGMPVVPANVQGQDLLIASNNANYDRVGYFRALNNLYLLAQPPKIAATMPEPYDYIKNEEI